jgi:non-canonical (house-cleaning) NTP pyrophosphatase
MRVGVTSKNKLKVEAVEKAYSAAGIAAEVIGYSADSKVGEQPVGEQTLEGARNRISDLNSRVNGLDRIISIENGIFRQDGQWLDIAVAVMYEPKTGEEHIEHSDAIVFPDEYVERARQLGFDTTTVGKVMADAGYISDQKDPHLSIAGVSRQVYLEQTVRNLVERVETRNIKNAQQMD